MRVIEVSRYGGPEVLVEVDRPEPEAAPGQVLVRVQAVAVNPADGLTRAGVLAAMTPHLAPPLVLGWDLAGTVLTAGGGFDVGSPVVGMIPWFAHGTGSNAEVVAVDPAWLAPWPDGMDLATAAATPLNALTARQAVDLLGLEPGRTLLVTGASGAVGGYAVQLAAAVGATVVAVGSTGDEDHVTGLGAAELLARGDAAGLVASVRSRFPDGVDAVLDAVPVGKDLIGAVRDGGVFVTVLDMTLPDPERGIRTTKVGVEPDAAQLTELVAAVAAGRLTTRVAEVMPVTDVAKAHELTAAGGLRGKIVLRF